MTDSPHFRSRLPHWGWLLLATVGLVVGFVGSSVWLPYHREQQAIEKIKSWGGGIEIESAVPSWLQEWDRDDKIKKSKVFDRIIVVYLSSTRISDSEMNYLSVLGNLRRLHLSHTAVTDAG